MMKLRRRFPLLAISLLSLYAYSLNAWALRYDMLDLLPYFSSVTAVNNIGTIAGLNHQGEPILMEWNQSEDSYKDANGNTVIVKLDTSLPASATDPTRVPIAYKNIHITGIGNASLREKSVIAISGWYTDQADQVHGIYWTADTTVSPPTYVATALPNYNLAVVQCPDATATDPAKKPKNCYEKDKDKDGNVGPGLGLAQVLATAAANNCTNPPSDQIKADTPIIKECDVQNQALGVNELGWIVGKSIQQTDSLERAVFWVRQEIENKDTKTTSISYSGFDLGYMDESRSDHRQGRAYMFSRKGDAVYGELFDADKGYYRPAIWLNVTAAGYEFPILLPRTNTEYSQNAQLQYEFHPSSKFPSQTLFDNLPLTVSSIEGSTIYGFFTDETQKITPIIWDYRKKESTTNTNPNLKLFDITFTVTTIPNTPTGDPTNINTSITGAIRDATNGDVIGTLFDTDRNEYRAFLYTGKLRCGLQDVNEILIPPGNDGQLLLRDMVSIADNPKFSRLIAKAVGASDGVERFIALWQKSIPIDLAVSVTTDHTELFVGEPHNYQVSVRNNSDNNINANGNYATCAYIKLEDFVSVGTRVEVKNGVATTVPDLKPGGLTFHNARVVVTDASGAVAKNRSLCTISYIDVTCRVDRIDAGQTATVFVESEARPLMADRNLIAKASVTSVEKEVADADNASQLTSRINRQNCFIATAAYGSYLDPHVKTLRAFRDQYLLTNEYGREFVEWYYDHSPVWAEYIRMHPELKPIVRALLTPLVVTVRYPVQTTAFGLLAMIAWSLFRRSKKRRLAI